MVRKTGCPWYERQDANAAKKQIKLFIDDKMAVIITANVNIGFGI